MRYLFFVCRMTRPKGGGMTQHIHCTAQGYCIITTFHFRFTTRSWPTLIRRRQEETTVSINFVGEWFYDRVISPYIYIPDASQIVKTIWRRASLLLPIVISDFLFLREGGGQECDMLMSCLLVLHHVQKDDPLCLFISIASLTFPLA